MPPKTPKVVVPVKDHFSARVTYRGTSALLRIKQKFVEKDLIERVKQQTPFGQFFVAEVLKFSGTLYHLMMLHKSVCAKENEVHFCFGAVEARFGLTEYALITGLNFSDEPSDADVKDHCKSDRILNKHFKGTVEKLSLKQLEDAFYIATDVDDIFKLGLCCLVEGVLITHEPKAKITVSYLKMVDDLEFFCKYPWGKVSFERMMSSLKKDMLHQLSLYKDKCKLEEREKHAAQYTVYGYAPSLQYWTYEAIDEIKGLYGERIPGSLVPRMLQWRSKGEPTHRETDKLLNRKNKLTMFASLNPRPMEKVYHASLTHTELPSHLRVGDEDIIDDEPTHEGDVDIVTQSLRLEQRPKETNFFEDQTEDDESQPSPSAPGTARQSSSAPGNFITPEHPMFRGLLETVAKNSVEQQKIAEGQQMLLVNQAANTACQSTDFITPDHPMFLGLIETVNKIGVEQQKIAADQRTLLANQQDMVENFGQLQSHVDILIGQRQQTLSETDHADVSISSTAADDEPVGSGDTEKIQEVMSALGPRTRKRPAALGIYTDPTKKKRTKHVQGVKRFELDGRPGPGDIRFFKSWVTGDKPTIKKVNCVTGEHDYSWFTELRTFKIWLRDTHMDAVFNLLRRRRHHLRDKFCTGAEVMDVGFHEQFEFIGNDFVTIDQFTKQYVNGDTTKFLAPWYPNVQEIYFCVNINQHWVAAQASLVNWQVTIYDSYLKANSDAAVETKMAPICNYFPGLLRTSGQFTNVNIPDAFGWRRCSKDEVPQQSVSGDCGMFAIKYIEYMMTGRDTKSITSEKMPEFRHEWSLDLFYQAILMCNND